MDFSASHWFLSWLSGNLSVLSPCVFPLLPLVLGGLAPGSRLAPLAMGAGMSLSFALLGVLLGAVGPLLGVDGGHIRTLGAVLLMLMGAWIWMPWQGERFTQWFSPLASTANTWAAHLHSETLRGAFGLGALLGLVWSPCSGPLLASALIMAASDGGAWSGALVLGFFGLGAATPLVAAAYVSRTCFDSVRQRVASRGAWGQKAMGIAIFATGLAVATNADKWLEAKILPWLPQAWLQAVTRF